MQTTRASRPLRSASRPTMRQGMERDLEFEDFQATSVRPEAYSLAARMIKIVTKAGERTRRAAVTEWRHATRCGALWTRVRCAEAAQSQAENCMDQSLKEAQLLCGEQLLRGIVEREELKGLIRAMHIWCAVCDSKNSVQQDPEVEECQIELWVTKHRSGFRALHSLFASINRQSASRAIQSMWRRWWYHRTSHRISKINTVAKTEISRMVSRLALGTGSDHCGCAGN